MKILHTSDWHLGRSLYGRKRYEEFAAFLDWLAQTIADEKIEALLVAGDIFDTSTPGNRAQELYYRFLGRVSASCCRNVVIIAGNHDSPSFLNAPGKLLRALNVYVIGAMTENPADEVIVLRSNPLTEPRTDRNKPKFSAEDNRPQAARIDVNEAAVIICAVPYLRDKDIRTVAPGETIDDKNRKLVAGLKQHYAEVVKIAEQKRDNLRQAVPLVDQPIPIIGMGHLFTAGGKTIDGDGVRELYVGSLAYIDQKVFPAAIDYLALGHLHVPQAVGDTEYMRYSGSPIAMGFGEAAQEKSVIIIEFQPLITPLDSDKKPTKEICESPPKPQNPHNPQNLRPKIILKKIPCFQQLIRIVGSRDDILTRLKELKTKKSSAWLEIEYTGNDIIGNLKEMIDEAVTGSAMEIRRSKNRRVMDRVLSTITENETLDDLEAGEVFTRCLDTFNVPDAERKELIECYNEVVRDLLEDDSNAE